MAFISFLKRLPIDLGQANLKHTSCGKLIALKLVGQGNGAQTLLDLGCRDGYFSRLLAARGFRVTSADIECKCEPCLAIDADKPLPFPEGSFDVIWCSEVIEHLANPAFTLSEFRRVLKPGGRAVLTTPNSTFWLYALLKLFGRTPRDVQHPGHKHFFSLRDIRSFGPAEGKVFGYFPYMILKCRISRCVGLLSPTFVFTINAPSP